MFPTHLFESVRDLDSNSDLTFGIIPARQTCRITKLDTFHAETLD